MAARLFEVVIDQPLRSAIYWPFCQPPKPPARSGWRALWRH